MVDELGPEFFVGDLAVSVDSRTVRRGIEVLDVGGLTFDFLLALASSAPAITSYEELSRQVWRGRPVTAETLTQRARLLRAALGDDSTDPHYFEAVRGHGYRLLVPVDTVPRSPAHPARTFPARAPIMGAALTLLMTSALVLVIALRPAPADYTTVAVLPFKDMSAGGDQGYLGQGMAEELIDELTRLEGLRVVSRTSSFELEGARMDARAIGKVLGASALLEGSVRRDGQTLRITAQLIDTEDGYHLWSNTYDRGMSSLLAAQDEIAAAVAGALGVTLRIGDSNAFRGAGTSSIEAYDAYLRALQLPGWGQRTQLLERAVQLDPAYGAALASLGLSVAASQWFHMPEEAPAIRTRAMPHIARAIALDPESAYAASLLAVLSYGDWHWEQSEQKFREAISRRPTGEMLEHYGNMLMRAGRSSAALTAFTMAANAERQPVIGVGNLDIQALLALRRFQELQRIADAGELEPSVDIAQFRYLLAINQGDLAALKPAFDAVIRSGGPGAVPLGELGDKLDSRSRMIDALKRLREDNRVLWPSKYHDIALLAAFFGAHEMALDAIATEARLTSVRYGALWQPVMAEARKLPAFGELVEDIGLVDYWRAHGWSDHCAPATGADFRCF